MSLNIRSAISKCIVALLMVTGLALAQTAATSADRQKMGGDSSQDGILREVRHELLMLSYYSIFDDIRYEVNGSNVTLIGKVTRPSLKSDAEASVKHIEGVESVKNNIEVLPVSPEDDRTRLRAAQAIYGFPSLSKYAWGVNPPIHIIVKNGRVILTGMVDNTADKNTAGIRANGLPDVFSVENDLQVSNHQKG
jgi:hyperosmotically inducible periplasmic protein